MSNAKPKAAPKADDTVNGVKVGISTGMNLAREKARERPADPPKLGVPVLMPGVVPKGETPAIAMDYAPGIYDYANLAVPFSPFPGYPYLSNLATRAEYRTFADVLSSEFTREWIKFNGATDGEDSTQDNLRIPELEAEIKRLNLREIVKTAMAHDCFFGRGQISINIKDAEVDLPLVFSNKTVKKGSLQGFSAIEAMWTTPNAYNSIDPTAPDFYKPRSWFVLGKQYHASRLLTIITRPLPDMLKAAYNFGGMSMSQLAEPYVNNWLRTRQSVSDLINNFSITALKTNLSQVLQGSSDGSDVFARADLFTLTKSNKGVMLLDKDSEDLDQVNTPLSGLHELQAQSQEHLSTVSRIPTVIYTGINPTGLNASSDGSIRIFYDWVSSQQEANLKPVLEACIKVIMLSLWGEIDETITFEFNKLWQTSDKEESEIRSNNANADAVYMDRGVLSAGEVKESLSRTTGSGYYGIEYQEMLDAEIAGESDATLNDLLQKDPPEDQIEDNGVAQDGEFKENDHPRDDNGKFTAGGTTEVQEERIEAERAKREAEVLKDPKVKKVWDDAEAAGE